MDVASSWEHAICFLYTAAVRGQQQYHGSRGGLARRLEFAGEDYLKQFINDESAFRTNEINKLNATKGSAPLLNERSKLLYDFDEIISTDIMTGIADGTSNDQKRLYILMGIRRVLICNFGETKEVAAFYKELDTNRHNLGTLANYYKFPSKFIEAVWTSEACPRWNPINLPIEDYLSRNKAIRSLLLL